MSTPTPTTTKYSRHRNSEEIRKLCKKAGFQYNEEQFNRGSDRVHFIFKHGHVKASVVYSVFNGQAMGEFTTDGSDPLDSDDCEWFDTNKTDHDAHPWFQALLEFIYVR